MQLVFNRSIAGRHFSIYNVYILNVSSRLLFETFQTCHSIFVFKKIWKSLLVGIFSEIVYDKTTNCPWKNSILFSLCKTTFIYFSVTALCSTTRSCACASISLKIIPYIFFWVHAYFIKVKFDNQGWSEGRHSGAYHEICQGGGVVRFAPPGRIPPPPLK